MIIAAYAGTGKSTLARRFPEQFTDFVCMPYKYELEQSINADESCKANPDNIMRDEWPYNYVSAIRKAMNSDKRLLIPTDWMVLALLRVKDIPYAVCYPQRDAKEIYRQRFIDRGNTQDFIDIFIGRWDEFLSSLEQDTYGKHIVLSPHQFISDVVDLPNGWYQL